MPSPAFSLALSCASLVVLTLVSGCGNRGDLYLESALDPALVEDLGAFGEAAPAVGPDDRSGERPEALQDERPDEPSDEPSDELPDEDGPDALRRSRRDDARPGEARPTDERPGDDER